MNTINDQNRRKLQQKYQKYKATQQVNSNILGSLDQNKKQRESTQDIRRIQINQVVKQDDIYQKILLTSPRHNIIFGAMLSDPQIYELSQMLSKQSQQKNKQTLISAFPQRYKGLLQTQAKFKVYQRNQKQNIEKRNKQVQMLMAKLLKAQNRLKQQEQIINEHRDKKKNSEQNKFMGLAQEIKKKDMQLINIRDQYQILLKKFQKIKQQHKNSNQIILELRQSQQNYHHQTQRLVQKLKQVQQKLSKAHKRILQFENDKKIALKSYQQESQQKIKELKQQKKHLQQLLQQANNRIQYKQSLLKMSDEQHERALKKLQDQNVVKHDQLQRLREEHLQALRAIDQLQQRVNRQQEQIVRGIQINDSQKEQLKKQLQKYHQLNGQVRAQLDVKSQLVRVLQKSIQCMKKTFQSDVNNKNTKWLQLNKQLLTLKSQHQATCQLVKDKELSELEMQSQIKNLKIQLRKLKQEKDKNTQQLSYSQEILKKYLDKIIEQQQLCLQLKWKIQQFIQNSCNDNSNTHIKSEMDKKCIKQENSKQKKVKQYQIIIQKLKNQIILLTNNSRSAMNKQGKILHQLIQQNKKLKRQSMYAQRIQLFSQKR